MADIIKIGSLDISAFKVGSSDCKIYLGTTLLYSGGTTPPTPTYEWKQYNAGDTIPSKLFYGVKLGNLSMDTAYIEFGDSHTGIAFTYDANSEYGWYAKDLSGEQIDITEYYDETENCFIIYFSDLGFGAMPISYPVYGESFEFDVQLYQEHTSTLQWVSYSEGDAIPNEGVYKIYGFKIPTQTLLDIVGNGNYLEIVLNSEEKDQLQHPVSFIDFALYSEGIFLTINEKSQEISYDPESDEYLEIIFSDYGVNYNYDISYFTYGEEGDTSQVYNFPFDMDLYEEDT